MTGQNLLRTLCVVLSLGFASTGSAFEPTPRIIGGSAVAIAFPWMVSIQFQPDTLYIYPFCGGTLIADQWVLTAAHCMFDPDTEPARRVSAEELFIVIGARDILNVDGDGNSLEGDSLEVEEIHVYPGYSYNNFTENDIALIKLAAPSSMASAPLTSRSEVQSLAEGEPMLAMGWGATNPSGSGPYPDILHSVYIPLRSSQQCSEVIEGFDEDLLCAGDFSGGLDTCLGDSGGPLMVDIGGALKLAGIVSFGLGDTCGEAGTYGGYTNVSSYRSWISAIQNNEVFVEEDNSEASESGGSAPLYLIFALLAYGRCRQLTLRL